MRAKLIFFSLALNSSLALAAPSLQRQNELRRLLDQDCGSCHGLSRRGGLGSPLLPENLINLSEEALTAIILDGRPGTPMPPWREILLEEEAVWLACHLKKAYPKESQDGC